MIPSRLETSHGHGAQVASQTAPRTSTPDTARTRPGGRHICVKCRGAARGGSRSVSGGESIATAGAVSSVHN